MSLSAVMLCYNEVFILPATLVSLKECVSEIVVVDMGSDDGTLDYLNANLRRQDKIVSYTRRNLYQFGFSHPRNYGAKFATGQFILAIDADELILPDEFLPAWDRSDKTANVFAVSGRNYLNPHHDSLDFDNVRNALKYDFNIQPCPRIYRNTPSVRYEGIIHEAIWDREQRGYDMSPPFVDVIHHLAEFKEERGRSQGKQNLYAFLIMRAQAYPGFRFGNWDHAAVNRDMADLFRRANIFAAEHDLTGFEWEQVAPGKPRVIV